MKRISRRDSKQDMGQTAHVSKVVGGCSLSVNWLVACLAQGQDVAPNHVTAYSTYKLKASMASDYTRCGVQSRHIGRKCCCSSVVVHQVETLESQDPVAFPNYGFVPTVVALSGMQRPRAEKLAKNNACSATSIQMCMCSEPHSAS